MPGAIPACGGAPNWNALYNADNYNLILEMVASQVIAGYTFWLTNPNDVNINGLAKIVSQTLRLIEI